MEEIDNKPKGEQAEENLQEEVVLPEFCLHITGDRMEVYLRVANAPSVKTISFEQINEFLRSNQIAYGICENEIQRFCDSKQYYKEFICAKGLRPVEGKDGTLTYRFNTSQELKPKEREDGTVDYRNLDLVQNVCKGEILCEMIPPEPGSDGMDVFNRVVSHKPGQRPPFPFGRNTELSEDQLSLVASIDGCIEYKNNIVNINDVFTVRGNVDSLSGNIRSVGSVIVQGDVLEGFSVLSDKDVTVRGMVEGAHIEAGGSIMISNGMNGMGKGVLKAGGNITAKFFENANINADGDIYADVMLNCRAVAEGSIILRGQKALMIGGSYQAGKSIVGKTIGNPNHTKITVSIASKTLDDIFLMGNTKSTAEELENKLRDLKKALEDTQEKITGVSSSPADEPQAFSVKKKLMNVLITQKGQIHEAINSIQEELDMITILRSKLTDYKVVVSGIMYPGTKLEIGPHSLQIQQENSNMKFYDNRDEIIFAPVLPSDLE